MSHEQKKSLSVKPANSTSIANEDTLVEELQQLCRNVAHRYVALRVPGNLLSLLVDLAIQKGFELIDHWGEEDSDAEWEPDSEEDEE